MDNIEENGTTTSCSPKEEMMEEKYVDSDIEYLEIKGMETEFSAGENNFTNMFVDVSEVVHSSEDELTEEDPLSEKGIINATECTTKNLQQLPPCKNGCHLKITEEDRKKTLSAYSKQREFRSRFNFVTDMIVMVPMVVNDKKSPGMFKKVYNTSFYIRTIEGPKKVCKACLTLILEEKDNFISTVLVKKFLKINKMLQSSQDSNEDQGILQKTDKAEMSNIDLTIEPERERFSADPYLIRDVKLARGYTRIPPCKYKCFLKISKHDQRNIFESYWKGATFHSRIKFIKSMTKVSKRVYSDQIDGHGNPEYIANYNLRAKKGLQQVCRTCFRIALAEPDKFITEVLDEKLRESSRLAEFKEPRPLDDDAQLLDAQSQLKGEPFSISDDGMRLIWNRLQHCKEKCYLKVTEADQIRTFDVYRRALTLLDRYNFFKEMTDMIPNKQPDVENSSKAMKNSAVYYINTKTGRTRVCKCCFRHTINESDFLMEAVFDEKWRQVANLNQPNDEVPLQLEDLVRNPIIEVEKHIKKFPLCEIHDFSAQNTEKYLPMGLSLEIMYYLYVKEVCNPVGIDEYHEILNLMNLKFQPAVKKYTSPKNLKEQLRLNYHVVAFESAQKLKSMDEIKAEFANNSLVLCLIGLRRSLPTPWLNNPAAFYKRPLWIHNLTIRQNSGSHLGRPKFYMWDETQGKQSPNEIASCLYQYLLDLPPTVKTVIVCSNCGEESRSKTLSIMFSHLMAHHKTLETIEHKFLTSAPFHSDDNLDNILTEKTVKKYQGAIQHPKDWYNALSKPRKSKEKPEVVVMSAEKFYDFESHWKDPLDEDEPCVDKEAKWLRYTKEGVACYKNSWTQSYRFKVADLKLKSQCESVWNAALNNLGRVPLSKEKKNDLLDLLPLMSPEVTSFYEGLPVENNIGLNIVNNLQEKGESSRIKRDSRFLLKKNFLSDNVDLPKKASIIKSKLNFESNVQEFEREKEDERNQNDLGDEYVDLSKRIEMFREEAIQGSNPRKYPKARKSWKALPPCDEKCHLKIPQANQRRIFDLYSQIKLFESKMDFVSGMIKINSITPEIKAALKIYYTTYLVNTEEGSQNICRKCFVFIIGERDYFITKVLEEKFQEMDESTDLGEENPKTNPEIQECEIINEEHSSISNDDIIIERVVEKTLPELYELKETEEERRQLRENHQPEEIDEHSKDELINEPFSNSVHLTSKNEEENLTGSRKINSPVVQKVQDHINKFPVTEQGFAKYLPIGLTLEVMYDLYVKEVSNPVSINFYKKVLARTDLKFKSLILGICERCSTILEMMKSLDDPNERYKIDCDRAAHLLDARKCNKSKLRDEDEARNNSDVHVCSFAFQSSLPTPCLNESLAYYQHPLWTYNLIIEQQIIDRTLPGMKSYSYMWHEGDGKGTANEIASCLYQYLQNLPPSVKYVTIYSTACGEEARSKTLSMMFSHFISNHKTIKSVDHKFFVSGHSGIQKRLDNEWLELMNNHRGKIEVPDDWYQAANSNKQYLVIMNPEKFYDFESLWKDNGAKPFIDKRVKWLRYLKQGTIYSKDSWRYNDPFLRLNLNSEFKDLSKIGLCELGRFPITEKKKNGLLSLLPLMSLKARCFYERLPDEKILSRKSKGKSSSKRKRKLRKILPIPGSVVKEEVHLENGDLDYIGEEIDEPPIKISNKRDFIQLDAVSIKDKRNERSSISSHSLSKFLK
ncbi:uncharacterized protein LOC117179816 [Belonocnema kinseyi]|uniref:uncharacterized protein LOC117179816 n=1 Tax=Belonocnema kinseyi TaxID=2817044 RepID=UPI00143D8169|nr:uncharacterized protein LOC117179816 [Belonocnema kinseyi]XP_033227838.1 uncharacterized protein LOC117179816 [Belonocnema kinseyi]